MEWESDSRMEAASGGPARPWIEEIEYLRGFGVLGVVMIHTTAAFVVVPEVNALVVAAVLLDVLAHFAVPLFVLISGYVLARRYERVEQVLPFYRRRLGSIVPPYLLFSALYLFLSLARGNSVSIADAVLALATASSHYHLWFIAVIVQLYLLYPVLIRTYRWFQRRGAAGWFLAGCWLVQVLWLGVRGAILESGAADPAAILLERVGASHLFYFAVGIALGRRRDPATIRGGNTWRGLAALLVAVLGGTVAAIWLGGVARYGHFYRIPQREFLLPALIEPLLYLAIAWLLFDTARGLAGAKGRLSGLVYELGTLSLGIYLAHELFRVVTDYILARVGIDGRNWVYYPVVFVATVALSWASVKAASRLPFSRWTVGARYSKATG